LIDGRHESKGPPVGAGGALELSRFQIFGRVFLSQKWLGAGGASIAEMALTSSID
jgi:hypothetical protein